MKTTLPFFTLLLSVQCALAQFDIDVQGLTDVSPYNRGTKGFDLRYEGVRGTPLLFEDWQMAAIQLINRDSFSANLPMNIDLEQNVLVFQMRTGNVGQVPVDKLQAFKPQSTDNQAQLWKVFAENTVENTDKERGRFYQVLYAGNYTLLKSVRKKFTKANFKDAYSLGNRYDEYVREEDYWLQAGKAPFQKIKLKRKTVEEALTGQASRIEKIVKNQKLDLGKETDVVTLLKALDEASE